MGERHGRLATLVTSLSVAILGALILAWGLLPGAERGRLLPGGAVLGAGVVASVRAWRRLGDPGR